MNKNSIQLSSHMIGYPSIHSPIHQSNYLAIQPSSHLASRPASQQASKLASQPASQTTTFPNIQPGFTAENVPILLLSILLHSTERSLILTLK